MSIDDTYAIERNLGERASLPFVLYSYEKDQCHFHSGFPLREICARGEHRLTAVELRRWLYAVGFDPEDTSIPVATNIHCSAAEVGGGVLLVHATSDGRLTIMFNGERILAPTTLKRRLKS
jgi:hypothetical protein